LTREKGDEIIIFYIDFQVMEDLCKHAEEKGHTVTMAMERILHAFLDEKRRTDNP